MRSGSFANNNTLISWGTSFQTNNSWILGASLFMVALQTLILISGTKATFRWQNYSFIIAMAGTLVAFIVLLIGSQGDFFSHFDTLNKSFGGGNVAAVIKGAPGAAAAAPNFWNFSATLPTLFSIQGFMMWNFWSVYMSGELKSASNRRRQLSVMFGALGWDTVLLVIGVLLLFRVAGYNFVYALNSAGNAAYQIPSGPVLSLPRIAGVQHADPDHHNHGLVPVLVLAIDDREHLHADQVLLRVVVRPAHAREPRQRQRADPFAGQRDHRHQRDHRRVGDLECRTGISSNSCSD